MDEMMVDAVDNRLKLAIVIDTNYFVAHLQFIKQLLEGLPAKTSLYIPYIVIQELDGLKQAHNARVVSQRANVAECAREAIRFLHSVFSLKRRILGQSSASVIRSPGKNNDDLILDCCLSASYLAQHVVLLSNDKNLAVKAMMHSILVTSAFAGSHTDYLTMLSRSLPSIPVPKPLNSDPLMQLQSTPSESLTFPSPNEPFPSPKSELKLAISFRNSRPDIGDIDEMEVEFHDPMLNGLKVFEGILLTIWSNFCSTLLFQLYGPDWTSKVMEPPWTLSELLAIMTETSVHANWPDWYPITPIKNASRMIKDLERSSRIDTVIMTKGDLNKLLTDLTPVLSLLEPFVSEKLVPIQQSLL